MEYFGTISCISCLDETFCLNMCQPIMHETDQVYYSFCGSISIQMNCEICISKDTAPDINRTTPRYDNLPAERQELFDLIGFSNLF